MKVVIMAGGKGTRISSVANDIPKPMISIEGKPILEHELLVLKEQGLTDIIIVTGHLGEVIRKYFKTGSNWGVDISYFHENTPLGTAGALYYLKDLLTEDFILLNADIIFDIDFSRMIRYHFEKKADVTLLTHPNNHPYDSALIATDDSGKVIDWINKEEPRSIYKNRVNAGVHIVSPRVIKQLEKPNPKIDLDRAVLKPLVYSGNVFAYDTPEYIKDMGTPERYYEICHDYIIGRIQQKNLQNKQKAVFLDRDGTINKYCGFVTKPEQIELLEGVADAIKKINSSGYLAIIITNQPVIARGECTFEELQNIHFKLETELGKKGAYVDDIFFCPHHPDKGFPGERVEYKKKCTCRKPNPGLLLQAAEKYNIDMKNSFMVGDSVSDVEAGKKAGCQSFLITNQISEEKNTITSLADFVCKFIK